MNIKKFLIYSLTASWFWVAAEGQVLAMEEEAQASSGEAADEPSSAPMEQHIAGRYLASQFAKNSGHFGRAIDDLERVHEEQPEDVAIALQLQGMLLVEGRMNE